MISSLRNKAIYQFERFTGKVISRLGRDFLKKYLTAWVGNNQSDRNEKMDRRFNFCF